MAHIPASIVQHPIADLDEVAGEDQDSHCLERMRICGGPVRGAPQKWGKPDQWQYNIPGDIAAPQFLMLPFPAESRRRKRLDVKPRSG
jgi:hypothetical protein